MPNNYIASVTLYSSSSYQNTGGFLRCGQNSTRNSKNLKNENKILA